jgi:hypothetical protein
LALPGVAGPPVRFRMEVLRFTSVAVLARKDGDEAVLVVPNEGRWSPDRCLGVSRDMAAWKPAEGWSSGQEKVFVDDSVGRVTLLHHTRVRRSRLIYRCAHGGTLPGNLVYFTRTVKSECGRSFVDSNTDFTFDWSRPPEYMKDRPLQRALVVTSGGWKRPRVPRFRGK